MKRLFGALVCLLLLAGTSWGVEFKADLRAKDAPEHTVWLSSLDLSTMTAGWGRPHIDTSIDGNPIKLNKKVYTHGVGTHAVSDITIDLRGVVTRFQAMVGIDDEVNDQGSLTFSVFADGRSLLETRILKGGDEPFFIDLGLSGVRTLRLHVGNANGNISCDHGDWAGALLWLDPAAKVKPVAITPSPPPALSTAEPIITAKDDTSLRINGPVITGVTPGRPLQFCHPTTGIAPFTYTAENLPAGLQLDPATGIVSGTVATAGEYPVTFTVTSKGEKATRTITIVAGENKVGLTPPMGWNAGYVLGRRAEVSKVKEYADLLVKSGLASRGYQYVILGDGWQGARNAAGELQVNPRFGDLPELAKYLHQRGLKLGIYSTPGEKSAMGAPGSAGHEEQDAKAFAAWGVDYLAYDWGTCKDPDIKAPYQKMSAALQQTDRDIFYAIEQYGMGNVWEWGEKAGGNSWRTGANITDSWDKVSPEKFNQATLNYAGPGHWNDYDMLMLGKLGSGGGAHNSKLTPNEQQAHMTLMSMVSAPLILGCDLNSISPYTMNLLANNEVLAINQDALGTPARRVKLNDDAEVWSRQLANGTLAVALFNRGVTDAQVLIRWDELKLTGLQQVRNIWQQTEQGNYPDGYSTIVPGHGVTLLRVGTPKDKQ